MKQFVLPTFGAGPLTARISFSHDSHRRDKDRTITVREPPAAPDQTAGTPSGQTSPPDSWRDEAPSGVTAIALTTVALIEDHAAYRMFIAELLRTSGRYTLAGSFETAEAAMDMLPQRPADVALVDITLPAKSGIEAVAHLRGVCPAVRCVMLTGHDDADFLFAALAAGAAGYLLKDAPGKEILAGLDELLAGGAPMSRPIARRMLESFARPATLTTPVTLTARETEIMESLAQGLTYKEIGRKLGISGATVKNHLYRTYEKLAVRSRTEAVVKWLKR